MQASTNMKLNMTGQAPMGACLGLYGVYVYNIFIYEFPEILTGRGSQTKNFTGVALKNYLHVYIRYAHQQYSTWKQSRWFITNKHVGRI